MTKMEPIVAAEGLRTQVQAPAPEQPAPVRRARFPWFAVLTFLLLVGAPMGGGIWYLEERAGERFASRTAFSIRSNEDAVPMEIFGAISRLSGGSTGTDAQILYDFIQSQQIVRGVAKRIDLQAIFAKEPQDPLFTLPPGAPIEDMLDHWMWMIDVAIDPSTGLLSVEARAFSPDDARAIAAAILKESIELVNRLSDGARADLVQATARELAEAETRLRTIRARLRAFRDHEQEVDPTLNAQATLALVAALEEDRARAQVKMEQVADILDAEAPQIRTLRRRISTLDRRIAEERTRLGTSAAASAGGDTPLSEVVGKYEELLVDREFAEQAYTVALANQQQAQVEARRRHRHLAVHIRPTLSDRAEYPDRPVLILTALVLCLTVWSIVNLVAGNIAERR